MSDVLDLLADKHDDWVSMAISIGKNSPNRLTVDDANELVQEMYLRLHKYVDDPERITYGDEINTFYVYVTLRNLYTQHLKYTHKLKPVSSIEYLPENDMIQPKDYDVLLDTLKTDISSPMEKEIESWCYYDNRIFKLVFYEGMSMRKLSRDTKISLTSIFNTVKNCKQKLKEIVDIDYTKLKNYEED